MVEFTEAMQAEVRRIIDELADVKAALAAERERADTTATLLRELFTWSGHDNDCEAWEHNFNTKYCSCGFETMRPRIEAHLATLEQQPAGELAAERELAKAVVFRATAMISGIGQWMNEGDGVERCVACRAPVTAKEPYWSAHHHPGCAVVELRKAITAYEQHTPGSTPAQAQEG